MAITYRSFLNSDLPHLVDIWRSQPPQRALVQPMSIGLFDELVTSKQYFDPRGLILALEDGAPIGFTHAAFGPNDAESAVAKQMGVTHVVMVRPHHQRRGIGRELLTRGEAYLRDEGAGVIYAGGIGHLDGFYLGLYGGSEMPGVLDSCPAAQQLFASAGYREIDRTLVFEREAATFRPPVDRRLMQWRRNAVVRVIHDPPARSWWKASTHGNFAQMRLELDLKTPAAAGVASLTCWLMETFSAAWGVHAAGIVDLVVAEPFQRQGLGMFLVGEAFQQLRLQNVAVVEAQTMVHNTAAIGLYRKLGFAQVDAGAVYRKDAPDSER